MLNNEYKSPLEILSGIYATSSVDGVRGTRNKSALSVADFYAALNGLSDLHLQYVDVFIQSQNMDYFGFEVNMIMRMYTKYPELQRISFVVMQRALKMAVVVDMGGGWCNSCRGTGYQHDHSNCASCGGSRVRMSRQSMSKAAGSTRDQLRGSHTLEAFEHSKTEIHAIRHDIEQHMSIALSKKTTCVDTRTKKVI